MSPPRRKPAAKPKPKVKPKPKARPRRALTETPRPAHPVFGADTVVAHARKLLDDPQVPAYVKANIIGHLLKHLGATSLPRSAEGIDDKRRFLELIHNVDSTSAEQDE